MNAEEVREQQSPAVEKPELDLLLDWKAADDSPPLSVSAIGSIAVHVIVILAALYAPALPVQVYRADHEVVDLRKAVPLVLPPDVLTQIAANKQKVSKEVDLSGLLAKPEIKPVPNQSKQARHFEPPPAPAPKPDKQIDPNKIEPAPNLQIAQAPPALGNSTIQLPVAVPPPPPPVEKPKLAFETPGTQMGSSGNKGLIDSRRTTVDDAARNVMRGAGATIIADSDLHLPGVSPNQGIQGRSQSSLELLSDPLGVDFRPYLISVLAAVRHNWFNILPEGARMGQRGRTVVQFSIAKDGSVPKLVIHFPSGTESLDRAAVAGISASNPFPPLPSEYKGAVLRLQLVFSYNMPGGTGLR